MLIIRVKYLQIQYNYNSNHYYLPEEAPTESRGIHDMCTRIIRSQCSPTTQNYPQS